MATEQNSTSPSAEAEATMSATALELLLPPAACLLAIVFGLILWAALNRKKTAPMVIQQDTVKDANHFKSQHPNTGTRSEKSTRIQPFSADVSHPAFFTDSSADLRCNQNNNENDLMAESIPTKLCAVQPLFSSQDLQLLENLDMRSLADIRELFCILLPVIFSLGFCPLTLFLHGSIVGLFWPHSMFASPPNINDAISCFLVPAGMVYAISFGFAFQQVAGGFRETEISMLKQVDQLKTILKIVDDLRVVHPAHRVTMVRTVKDVALATISQLRGHVVHNDNMTDEPERNVWGKSLDDIVRLAYTSAKVKDGDMWQSALLRRLEKLVVHDDSFFMLSLKRRIHAVQWAFLEALGYFTFLGMLLVRCESYRAELAMCLITVISISLLCYLVADLDSPFHGFFRVDLHCYDEVTSLLCHVFNRAVADAHDVIQEQT